MNTLRRWPSARVHRLNRAVTCAVVAGALGALVHQPESTLGLLANLLVRTHLIFLGTVMAHEASHGHLGRSRRANAWWGRLALLPSMVPFVNFRKTHHLHHAHTNVPGLDPDLFLKPRHSVEVPFRALAMPHHWYFWLRARGRISRRDHVELLLSYVLIALVYGLLAASIGPWRLLTAMVPALALVSLLLWVPFALKTHEGHSTGSPESRSHDYHGHLMFWFSLGLSMHRAHHLHPELSWIETLPLVEKGPERWLPLPRRDIRRDPA